MRLLACLIYKHEDGTTLYRRLQRTFSSKIEAVKWLNTKIKNFTSQPGCLILENSLSKTYKTSEVDSLDSIKEDSL